MNKNKVILIVGVVILLICSLYFYSKNYTSAPPEEEQGFQWENNEQKQKAKFLNKNAPGIVTSTMDQKPWKLLDYKGKVILIDYWATWCAPCIVAMPPMKEIYNKYKDREDFLFVGVALDEDREKVVAFCKNKEIPWLQLFEENKGFKNSFARAFDIFDIPSVWIIDKNFKIVGVHLHGQEINNKLEKLLTNESK